MNPMSLDSSHEEIPNRAQADWIVAYENHVVRGGPAPADLPQDLPGDARQWLADAIRTIDALREAFGKDSAPAEKSTAEPPPQLGDFRILGEIGRGGMGVVYEAEQISLGRRVALKVLPFTALLDEKRIKRFQNEARAAGTLDHPNIVPVIFVGEDRGVYYYAMSLVRGRSVAEVIAQMRVSASQQDEKTPNTDSASDLSAEPLVSGAGHQAASPLAGKVLRFPAEETRKLDQAAISTQPPERKTSAFYRTMADLGAQAAEALHHAHEHGVLHRDIKPANLLIDQKGKLWITDFGLARLEADAGMTMTGDVLGTLRYMSPEQALAKRVVVDHRTDIYSLGATLYELLTLHPALAAADRQELLNQIAFDDPRLPRTLEAAIPRELETITLRAMEKDPADRYQTAQEMADDLRRFLDDRPILARPPSLGNRMSKWLRRHKAAAWSAAVVLLFLMAGSTLSSVKIWREKNRTETALTLAQQHAHESYRNLYLSHMRLGKTDWDQGQVGRLRQLLAFHLPQPGRADLRDWEWYYLLSLCNDGPLTINGHKDLVYSVAWSPDGRQLASASLDRTGKIWDSVSGQTILTLHGHEHGVVSVAWSLDSRRVATGSDDGTIKIWDAKNGRDLCTLHGHVGAVRGIAWCQDNQRLASASHDGTVRIWNATTGVEVSVLGTPGKWVRAVSWAADGRIVVAGNKGTRVWSFDEGVWNSRHLDPDSEKLCSSLSPNGLHYVSSVWNGDIEFLDTTEWSVAQQFSGHNAGVDGLAWSPDSTLLATGGRDQSVKIFDVADGRNLKTFRGHTDWVNAVSWHPDGRRIASCAGNEIKVWNAMPPYANGLQPSHDRESEGRSSHDGKGTEVSMLPTDLKQHIKEKKLDHAWSPDGRRVATAGSDQSLEVWDPHTGKEIASFDKLLSCEVVVWHPDSRHLAAVEEGAAVIAWNVDNETRLCRMEGGRHSRWDYRMYGNSAWIYAMAWNPVGQQIAHAGWDQVVYVLDVSSGRIMQSLRGHTGCVVGLAWSPNGQRIASLSRDKTLRIWDAKSGNEIMALFVDCEGVRSEPSKTRLHWSADGRTLALINPMEKNSAWDASTGYKIAAEFAQSGTHPSLP